ncbi:MAG TPA: hypothetical protein VJS64_06155 [Pyrinomonadaceae bacterium]|nr:hypothetical protein [Pyrinomonadaceae bacterium]
MANLRPVRNTSAVTNSRKLGRILVALILITVLVSCAKVDKPKTEAAPVQVANTEPIQPAASTPPPELNEVKEAVRRVFKDSVEIDSSSKPIFIAGDFNGDTSQDIAVVIKPVPDRLADLNQEFPNWILKDPFAGDEPRIPRLRVATTDSLLAVIHGHGPTGWRDSQATQTFLLKNAIGSGMTVRQPKNVTKTSNAKTPYLRGEVIGEVVDGNPGYLYFAGATYAWYDPKTFVEETDNARAHMRTTKRTK